MSMRNRKPFLLVLAFTLIYFWNCGQVQAQAPTISSTSPTTGAVGTPVTITGTNFGSSQGSSTLTFNGTPATPTSWSATTIVAGVPAGATTGNVVVTVAGVASNGVNFAVNWSNGYVYRRAITIDHTKVSNTDQTNFPVLISGTYSYLATTTNGGNVTNTNGYDIIFTSDANGSNKLPFQQEGYNASTGAIVYWVQIPTVSHTADTVVYLFYGNSSISTDQSNKTAVWDSNYLGVWHSGEASGNLLDSTSNNNPATPTSLTQGTAGEIGNAATYNGSTSHASVGNLSLLNPTLITISAWINATSYPNTYNNIACKEQTSDPYFGYELRVDGGQLKFFISSGGAGSYKAASTTQPSTAAWHHVVGTYDGSNIKLFLDGSQVSSVANSGNMDSANASLWFGDSASFNGRNWNGSIDEVRISNSARSADWIATEYKNQSSPSTFYTLGAAANGGAGGASNPAITSLSPTFGAISALVTISGANFGTTQGTSTVTFNGTTATPTSWSATTIVAPVPNGATTGYVIVNVGGVVSNGLSFPVVLAPSITSLSPTSGVIRTSVTITGANFGASQGSGTVSFNGTAATPTSWGATSIVVPVPMAATTGNVFVNTAGVQSNGVNFTVLAGPSIASVSPASGAVGSSITITGSSFGSTQGGSTVNFNGTTATPTSWSATSIVVPVPSGATTGNLTVSVGGVTSNTVTFTVVPVPSISSLSPTTGAVGAEVIIAGANFGSTQGTGTVKFNGTAATPTSWSASSIAVPVPSGATTGNVVVTAWGGVSSNGVGFTVVPAPSITSLSVTSGVVGTSVTITGTNFGTTQGSGTASFNGTAATPTSWGATSIVAPVPVDATSGNVTVTASGVASNGINFTVVEGLSITSISPSSGVVGSEVVITGTGFEATQGTSTISLNGINAAVASWNDKAILAIVPAGASSGPFSVTVNSHAVNSATFTVTTLPSGWSDGDVGSVGIAGSASFGNGTFTVKASGNQIYGTSDQMHFVYQALSGDGTIVARVVSLQGSNYPEAGVMIRETLNSGAANGYSDYQSTVMYFSFRGTTGGSTTVQSGVNIGLPYWAKLVRSGNTLTAYSSYNGTTWTQTGTSQTITMAQNVYIGMAVSSQDNTKLATATFDNVSVNSTAVPAPVITSVSATTGSVGTQVAINGSGFGTLQSTSLVTLNNAPVTVNTWTSTSIGITIPAGATSGYLVVSVAPSMNDSNPVFFTVTSQPLPSSWLDQDVGPVQYTGSATYANGTFTVNGSGLQIGGTSDQMHFVYQPLQGDGTIIARVVSTSGSTYTQAGVMIRETLDPSATNAFVGYQGQSQLECLWDRTTTGGSTSQVACNNAGLPYWVKLVRSSNTFNGFVSYNGLTWIQVGTSQTITMVQTVYVGLAVSSNTAGGLPASLATGTFDNVSINSTAAPAPVITSVSTTTGSIGSQVDISGSGFGASQYGSLALLNDAPVTINTWSNTAISITIPTGATSGYLVVSVAPNMNDSNAVYFTVTTHPLPTSWLDQDVGPVQYTGSATYTNGTFTVNGSGLQIGGTSDQMHFVYQPLQGDGTIIARVISTSGSTYTQAGVMIRETLDPSATNAFVGYQGQSQLECLWDRTTTGGSTSQVACNNAGLPYWVKLVRSSNTFNGYVSYNGLTWIQVGTSQTISMAQTVYVGLAVSSNTAGGLPASLATGTFDNVSVNSTAAPAPIITTVSATTGSIGSQVMINGSGFGAAQYGSLVLLNDASVTINSWSNTAISITIPTGATSGYLVVSVAPNMNDSNAVYFTVTSQPLPASWLDQDVGPVQYTGSATYASGTFTVNGSGLQIGGTSDQMHFVYQPLQGDGTIIARVVSTSGSTYTQAGVMIRETLDPSATNAFVGYQGQSQLECLWDRTTTGGSTSIPGCNNAGLPYWVKLVRSGSTFAGYASSNGSTWTQLGSTQTISMAQTVYVGLAVSSNTAGGLPASLATGTFDNVSITLGTTPFVTGLSPTLGSVSTSVTITGSSFGATQGTSTVSFNGAVATSITSWSSTQIVALVPTTAASGTGPVTVTVNSIPSLSDLAFTVIHPVISSLSPPAAQIGGSITLNGTGFGSSQGTSQVKFNSLVASVTSWSDSSVTVTVPTSATSGPVTLTELGFPSNGVQFTVSSPLTVTGISQSSGPIGTTITITGTGFGATQSNSVASFYGAAATVNSWSDTQIVATMSAGSASGPVSVSVGSIWVTGPWFTLTATAQLTDSLGNPTTYVSAMIGGLWVPLTSQGSGCSSCSARGTIQNTYDTSGHLLSRTDELGRTTSKTYDSNGNVTSISVPIAADTYATTQYTYNNFGEVLTTTDPMGNTTTNTYDSSGNLLSVTTPAPNSSTAASVTQFAYNSLGELTQITDPLGNVTKLAYYPTGLINTITDAQQNVTTYAYDTHGNRTSVKDANNQTTTFAYDAGDRLKTITYPGSTGTTTFGYDYRGRRTTVTDQNNKTTTYAYDDADRLLTVTDAATPGNVTTYGYDTESNLTSIKDANGNTTSFSYDAFGRVTKTTFPSTLAEYYYYDAVGNLTSKTDRKNQTITYTYDQLNRLTQKLYPDSSTVNYTYDNDSRLTQVVDPTGTYSFTFDNMGRLTGTTTSYAFLTGRNFTTSYGYDAGSNRTGFTDPESGATSYAYDTLNRLQTLTPPAAFSATGNFGFTYDALSRRTQMTRPNGLKSVYAYDNLSHLQSVLHQSGSTTLDGAAYGVDNAGNRTSRTPQPSGTASNFSYDNIYELTGVTQNSTTTESYTYDAVGNRLSSLGVSPYTNNTSNELTSTPSTTYTYDNDGNLHTKVVGSNTTTYAWDFENRLTSVTLPGSGGTVSFKYDPFGRRIYKSSSSGTSVFAYDGDNLVEETNATGAAVARYEQTQNVDEPLAMLRSAATSYFHADGLGSVTSLSSTAGSIVNTYTYDSFGKLTASTGSLVNPFQYTARESDSETGLYYYRARYYDSGVGRFLNEDPPGFLSGGINFYKYVGNSPLGFTDPNGMQAQPASTCCDPNKTKEIVQQLQDAFSGSAAGKSKVFQKYKPCLQKMLGDIKFQCGPPPPNKPDECGHTVVPGTVFLTPNGIAGKGGCKAAKSTVAHEMVHSCYNSDFDGPDLNGIDQEKEAFGIECQLFGLFCDCARDPKLCGY